MTKGAGPKVVIAAPFENCLNPGGAGLPLEGGAGGSSGWLANDRDV